MEKPQPAQDTQTGQDGKGLCASQATPVAQHTSALSKEAIFPQGSWKEWVLFTLLLLWGYLFASYPPLVSLGIQVTLLELSAMALLLLYLWRTGNIKISWLWLGIVGLSSLSFSLFENSLINGPLFLLQFPLFSLCLLSTSSPRPLDPSALWNGVALLIASPFSKLGRKWTALFSRETKQRNGKNILMGIVVTLPVLAVATVLLMGADERFADILARLMSHVTDNLASSLVKGVIAAILAAYLFSMLLSAAYDQRMPAPQIQARPHPTTPGILVGSLCFLYIAFLAIQAQAISQMWSGTVQEASYYSAMARGGFFELCLVALLNLAVFVGTNLLVNKTTRIIRALLTLLGGLTLLVIITGVAKMAIYMDIFGLTLLRVHTTWFMISLFLAFGILIAAQWTRLPAFRWIAVLALASVLAVSYANIGGWVTRINVDRYLEGSLSDFDMKQYPQFAYEAAPELIRLYENTGDSKVKRDVQTFLFNWTPSAKQGNTTYWPYKSVQQLTAEEQLRKFAAQNGSQK